jgi:hypothetical protein
MQELIRSMDTTAFLFVNAFLLAIASVAIYASLHARRRAALVKATPTSNIGMAQDGYCEFEGTVEAIDGPPVISPLTRIPCAWYHARLQRWNRGGRNSDGSYVTIEEATSGAPIMLRDSTGVCLIFPYGAEVTPTDKSQWTGPTAQPADRNPPKVGPEGALSQGFTVSGTANTKYRYFEERIYIGDPLLVLGEFTRRQFEAAEEDEEDVEDFDEDDHPDEPEAADDDVAAEDAIDAADWDDSDRANKLTTRAEQTTRACIQRGSGSKPFIVTTTPQATHVYVTEIGGQAAMYVALVPLSIIGLMLYARFG